MNCNNLKDYLKVEDFRCVGIIAKHCDLEKLCIAIEEAKNFDIIPLFCYDFVNDVLENWNLEESNPDYSKYQQLICENTYQGCSGKSALNIGLKKVWVYYAYARYLLINGYNDTANGLVQKTNEFSLPTPLKEVTDFSNKYRKIGYEAYKSVHSFLCKNKADYPKFDSCNCLDCGCTEKCTCGKTKKLTGFKFSIIRK